MAFLKKNTVVDTMDTLDEKFDAVSSDYTPTTASTAVGTIPATPPADSLYSYTENKHSLMDLVLKSLLEKDKKILKLTEKLYKLEKRLIFQEEKFSETVKEIVDGQRRSD